MCRRALRTSLGVPMHWKLPLMKMPMRSHSSSASSMECAVNCDMIYDIQCECKADICSAVQDNAYRTE